MKFGAIVRKIYLILSVFLLSQIALSLLSYNTYSEDWPTFQHDASRRGFSTSQVPQVSHLNWTMEFENIIDGPLIADDKIFVHDINNYTITVVDIETREILNKFNDSYKMGSISNGMIFNLSTSYILYSVDIESGDITWDFDSPFGRMYGPNAVADNCVFITSSRGGGGNILITLHSLYEVTGDIKWTYNITVDSWHPLDVAVADGLVFVSFPTSNYVYGGGTVLALDEETGELIWRQDYPSWVSSMPTVHNGLVFFANYEEEIVALDEYGNGDNTTDTVWSFDIGDYTRCSPAVGYGMVYVGSTSTLFYALDEDPSDGIDEGIDDPDGVNYDLIWKKGLNNAVEDTSPIIADNKVIIPTRNGHLYALDAFTGDQIWVEYDTYSHTYSQRTTPAVAYDKLFYSFQKTLYVYSLNQKPIADITYNVQAGDVTTIFELNGSGSYDPDGEHLSYIWQLGDGNWSNHKAFGYQYSDDGIYIVNLTVKDGDRVYSDPEFITITVNNLPPVANATANRTSIFEGEGIRFDASASLDLDDPDLNYSWDFDDGDIAFGKIVYHNFTIEERYTVELTVTDDDGEVDIYQITIEVARAAQDEDNNLDFLSNTWNFIGLGVLILIIVVILVFLMSKYKRGSKQNNIDNEPIFPSFVEISCPNCNHIFDVPSEQRPLEIQCPNCGAKGIVK